MAAEEQSKEGMLGGHFPPGSSVQEATSPCPLQETPRQSAELGGPTIQPQHAAGFNRTMAVGIISWMTPLAWLERTLPGSPIVTGLRHNLQFPATQESNSISPVPVMTAATWMSLSSLGAAGGSPSLENKDPLQHPEGAGDPVTPPASLGFRLPSQVMEGVPSPCQAERTPIQHQEKETMVSPPTLASAETWTSPPDLLDTGVNTSLGGSPSIKDSTTETDSLLWHCSRDQLKSLSRAELEGRLESTLIIMEALSHQIKVCQEFQRPASHLGPADQRDAGTQTPARDPKVEERLYRDQYATLYQRYQVLLRNPESERNLLSLLGAALDEMETASESSRVLQEEVDTAYLSIQKGRRDLDHQQKQMHNLLSRFKEKLEGWKEKEKEMEKAVRAKEVAEEVLEQLRTHANNRIMEMVQSVEAQKDLHALLNEAKGLQADLCAGCAFTVEEGNHLAGILQENQAQMGRDYEAWKEAAVRYQGTMQGMRREVDTCRGELACHREICQNLEESKAELVATLSRVNELMVENAQLHRDLKDSLQRLSQMEASHRQLEQDKEVLSGQLMEKQEAVQALEELKDRLSQEKAEAEQERDSALRDARDASDCKEFLEQENQITRHQQAEAEEALKSTLSTLWQRSAQLEDLKDAQEVLRQERDSLRVELAGAKAEVQSAQGILEAFSEELQEMESIRAQFLEITGFLRGALKGEPLDAPKSRNCTPGRPRQPNLGASFVDSVLQAVAERDIKTPGIWSESTAFTKAAPPAPPAPAELKENLAACVQGLWRISEELHFLVSQQQEAAICQQAEIARLKQQLEEQERRWEAEVEKLDARLARLNGVLELERQNGNELQEIIRDQDRELQRMVNKGLEIEYLQEEVSQLKHALQKCETEKDTLWEELREEKPSEAGRVQERSWLRQEVGKLKERLLQEKKQNMELEAKYQSKVTSLEEDLQHIQQALRYQRKTEAQVKETVSRLPAEVAEMPEIKHLRALLS